MQVSTSWHPGGVLATRRLYRCTLIQGECRLVPPDIPGLCWPQEDSTDVLWYKVSAGDYLLTSQECAGQRRLYRCALIQGECRWSTSGIPGVCWPQEDPTDVLWYKVSAGYYLLTSQKCAGFRKTLQMYSDTRWVQVSTSWHPSSVLASKRPYRCALIQGECRLVPPDIPGVAGHKKTLQMYSDTRWVQVSTSWHPGSVLAKRRLYSCALIQGESRWVLPDIPGAYWPQEGPTGVLWYKVNVGGVPPDIPGVCWPQGGPTGVLRYKVNVGGVPPDIPGVCWPQGGPTGVLWYKVSAGEYLLTSQECAGLKMALQMYSDTR